MKFLSKVYWYRVGLAWSVLLNVILGGHSNQTFSARNHSWQKEGKYHIVPIINFITRDDTHCLKSYVNWLLIKDSLTKAGYKLW